MRLALLCAPIFLLVAACSTMPQPPSGPPTVRQAAGEPAPPQGRFYADCIAQAATSGAYDKEPGGNQLRFTCTGSTARAFYDGLGDWSARIGSELEAEGRTWRFSQKLERDPSGVDGCSTNGAGDYSCVVILNVGEFLGD